jgi:hypothetical protein
MNAKYQYPCNYQYTSFKVRGLRITACMDEAPDSGNIRIAFGYQSPKDMDDKKKGQGAANRAMEDGMWIVLHKSQITRDMLILLAIAGSVIHYPQGIKSLHELIGDMAGVV